MNDTQFTRRLARAAPHDLAVGKFSFGKTGLTTSGKPTYDEWMECGEVLKTIDGALHWWIGDWLNYGETKWGEKYAQAIDQSGLAYQTVANDKYVATKIDFSRRREKLSFSHHVEVASLPTPAQDKLLDQAEAQEWTRAELRNQARDYRQGINGKSSAWPHGKYQVIYADPAWHYSNSGFTQSAEAHYPTMPTEAICALDVPVLSDDNCALFLWSTSPLLPDGLQVMEAWGFEYKASMIWRKPRAPGIGWFVNTYHEILLIGVRGQAHPVLKVDSVIDAPVTEHSHKPDIFYELIEAMHPVAARVELFARCSREGWQAWGNTDVQ